MSNENETLTVKNIKGFTVRELIEALQKMDSEAIVILSSDEEGNDFGVCAMVEQNEDGGVILWPASGTMEVVS